MLQSKAGYIDARPLTASSAKSTCNARPDHTLGQNPTNGRRADSPVCPLYTQERPNLLQRNECHRCANRDQRTCNKQRKKKNRQRGGLSKIRLGVLFREHIRQLLI